MHAPMKKRTLSLAVLPLFSLLALLAPAGVRAEAPPLPAKAERALHLIIDADAWRGRRYLAHESTFRFPAPAHRNGGRYCQRCGLSG